MAERGMIVSAGVVILWLGLSLLRSMSQHRELLALSRARQTGFSEFCVHFPEVPRALLLQVYELVQRLVGIGDFRVLPSDNLCGTLGIDQGTLESELEDLFKNATSTLHEIETVADLVMGLAANEIAQSTASLTEQTSEVP